MESTAETSTSNSVQIPKIFTKTDPEGNVLADYIVHSFLGQGNFSTVYAVVHSKYQKAAALKQVDLSEMDESEVDQSFNEIKFLKMVKSPHVIRLLDAFGIPDKKTLCVVLELMDDGDLERCIANARQNMKLFSEPTIWNFLRQICAGLNDLHAVKILHRDLKPANVFLNKRGIVKIGDVGLSRLFSSKTKQAMTRLGTEFYMAPERNVRCGYHFKSDIWSLGCLAYELCALVSPFFAEQKNVHSLHRKIEDVDYPPIPSDTYTRHLTFFVESCLQKNPDDRPTAEECANASLKIHNIFQRKLKQITESKS